jgi:3-oxoadipate enol-lactonase
MGNNELIAYSLPSHPGTKLPGHQYGVPEPTQQRRAVAQREGLGKFHLLGISPGGSIARHFAGTYRRWWTQTVLMDCAPRNDDESRANLRAAAARRDGVKSLIPDTGEDGVQTNYWLCPDGARSNASS